MRHEGQTALQMRSRNSGECLAQRANRHLVKCLDLGDRAADRVGDSRCERRRRPRLGCRHAEREAGLGNRAPIGLAQAGVHALHPGLAVDKGVMNLGVNREHSVRHPVDHPTPKEWPVAIEGRLVQVGNEPQQVVVAGPGGERQMLDVVTGVPAHHLLKTGRAETQEARDIVKRRHRPVRAIRLDDLSHDGRGVRRLLEQQHRPDVRGAGP